MNPALNEVTEEDPEIVCQFCNSSKINQLEWGPLYQLDGITAHYFCILFSAGLSQRGADDKDGIMCFLPEDILAELMRGQLHRCKFCRKKNATIGCWEKTCKVKYHFPCGLTNGSAFYFIDNFESRCSEHKTQLKMASIPEAGTTCAICFDTLADGSDNAPLSPPCCNEDVFFHKRCVTEMGRNHGLHYFKCPLCNNMDDFSRAMRMAGVYLPDRDAAWEEEPDAFAELNQRYSRCDAEECLCPDGKDHYNQLANTPWSIARCGGCGASAIHMACGGLQDPAWHCGTCAEVLLANGRDGRDIVSRHWDSIASLDAEEGVRKMEASTDLGESVDQVSYQHIGGNTDQPNATHPEHEPQQSTAQQQSVSEVVSVVGEGHEDQQECAVETMAGFSTDGDNSFHDSDPVKRAEEGHNHMTRSESFHQRIIIERKEADEDQAELDDVTLKECEESNENQARRQNRDRVALLESTSALIFSHNNNNMECGSLSNSSTSSNEPTQPEKEEQEEGEEQKQGEEERYASTEDPSELEKVIPMVNVSQLAPSTTDLSEEGGRPRRSQRLSKKTANEKKNQASSTDINGPSFQPDRKTRASRRLPPRKVDDNEKIGTCSPIQIFKGPNKNRFKCPRCSKIFQYRSTTMQHMYVHSNEKCFRCPQCAKSFSRQDSVTRHMRTHTSVKPHQCPECPRSFAYGWYLQTHLRRHEKTKPFYCTVSKCGMRFVSSSELRRHEYSHTTRRPFKCSLCEKYYKERRSLRRHYKTSHQ